ncbi:hypothetical protein O3M35_010297 [Rhynocoris fuscipes]|uniref:Carbohydrate kinase FGGY N-terminal domain-containing protein n=1 Tax=Rhynocoris fuscipes TaxID=488301 RepID=A0AAW1CZV3_9HEMI
MILGIDVGTTSVKVCIYCTKQKRVVSRQTKDTQANVPSELGSEGNKQNPPKICSALHACVSRLPKDILKQVTCIGVCGQMHGVMLWHYSDTEYDDGLPWQKADNDSSRFDINPKKVSSLYTWQDTRCDPEFLASLPQPESHLKACSGYGCTTLFWLAKNRPEKLEKFNCAGTIQDFVVAMLCNLKKPIMSVQNAASWGYFNTRTSEWNKEILESAEFPVSLLPDIIESGSIAGKLSDSWHGIPSDTPVVAALGDLQCSVLSALHNEDDAVLNISTSAQLCFIASSFDINSFESKCEKEEFLPYFEGKYLAVAASLNGGNALATFITMLQQWCLELGSPLPQSTLWERAIQAASKIQSSSLEVIPTLLGERHAPNDIAHVSNINPGNLSLGQVFRATCAGIVKNLYR